jgi:hypothetical protein
MSGALEMSGEQAATYFAYFPDEPRHDLTDAEQRVVQEVLDEHVFVSGLFPIGDKTWAIYGSIPVDGEVIVAKFDNRADAESALKRIAAAEQETVMP